MIPFAPIQEDNQDLIELAFSADDRKEWLRGFQAWSISGSKSGGIPLSDSINKELILSSMADNIRSIPSFVDGLNLASRLLNWLDMSPNTPTTTTANKFWLQQLSPCSKFCRVQNLLHPGGQYGTRDTAKTTPCQLYLHASLVRTLFNSSDEPLLNQQREDNDVIEPKSYIPILSMVLVNGAEGMGTGWSTTIPCYNPVDIVTNLR
jgi:DNA topoisomerase-2